MRNRRHRHLSHTEVDSEGSWAISYGDMVTLLLTFFIIFFTADKYQMQKAMNIDFQNERAESTRKVAAAVDQAFLPDDRILSEVRGKTYQLGQRIYVEFSGVSFFASGKVEMTAKARNSITKFYDAYRPFMGNYNLSIRAFTDTRKVRARKHRYRDNLELSALRSVAVMRHLESLGVPLSNMRISGHGELRLSPEELGRIPAQEQEPSQNRKSKKRVSKGGKNAPVHAYARTAVLIIEPKEEL